MMKIEEVRRHILNLWKGVMVEVMLVLALHMYKEGYRSAGNFEIKFSVLKMYEVQIKTIELFYKDCANDCRE